MLTFSVAAAIYFVFFGRLAILLVFLMLDMVVIVIPSLKSIFYKSMFGEEAYTYMSVPVSFRKLAAAKVVSGTAQCAGVCLFMVLCIYYFMMQFFTPADPGYMDLLDRAAYTMIDAHSTLSDGEMTTASVIFIICTIFITIMVEGVFISAVIFCTVIIRNTTEVGVNSIIFSIIAAMAAIAAYGALTFLFLWLPGLFFESQLAIPQIVIAWLLKIAATYGLVRYSSNLLEKYYSLK